MTTTYTGQQGFRYFIGIVEAVDDPKQLGRARVRVINAFDDTIETDDLQWAHVLLPTTGGGFSGVGETPYLVAGSRVLGFYIDGNEKQQPIITHVMPIIADGDDNRNSISWLARGKNTIEKEKIGPEPDSSYAAEYPWNNVTVSKAGHVIEIDDTPDNERIHIYHKNGSYVEINTNGRVIIKSTGDNFVIVGEQRTTHVEKDDRVTIRGKQTVDITGNQDVSIQGSQNITVSGSITMDCSSIKMTGDLTVDGTITGGKVVTNNGTDLDDHIHSGVQTGSAVTGKPV